MDAIVIWDKNGAETDGTKWCHISFHIFMQKQKWIRKHRKQIWKQVLSEINMEQIRCGRGRKAYDCRNQETTWIMQKNSRNSRESKNLCPKPVTITRCNGGVGYVLLWWFSMTMSHIGPAKLAIKTTINGNSILVGNGSFRFCICSTGKRCSVSVSTSTKEFPFPFPFCKIPFPFSYFHSISIFPRKSQKVSAPLSSLIVMRSVVYSTNN
jgi:hypothetical protein